MKTKHFIIIGAILAIGAIGYFYFIKVQNPTVRWEVYPDYSENGDGVYGPRDQRYRRGGGSTYPDNGEEHDGQSQGHVIFGPVSDSSMGHKDSRATVDFNCGDGSSCVITVRISGNVVGGATVDNERIKIKAERISASGGTVPGSVTPVQTHTSSSGSKAYTLTLNGCGPVRVTAEFEETVTANNPEGIQNKFNVQIMSYGCE
jgi:hypothetical protein